MDREVQERHRRRWMDEGTSDSEYALNQSIEGFNELVDNMLAPTVHRVRCSQPLNNDIDILGVENVVISDLTRNEAVKDEKLLHTKLESIIDSGSYIWWLNERWIVLSEEHNAVPSHRTFMIRKCEIDANILINGKKYTYPVYAYNMTLYADGLKELVNLSVSSAKYSIMIAENEITNTLDVGSRFIIRGRAFEVSLIDDFTIRNVRTLTVCETVINSKDDLENDVAYNDNSEQKNNTTDLKIQGSDVILLGDTLEYTLLGSSSWDLRYGAKGVKVISSNAGKCSIKCEANSNLIGTTIILEAYDYGGNVIDSKEIRIRGMF